MKKQLWRSVIVILLALLCGCTPTPKPTLAPTTTPAPTATQTAQPEESREEIPNAADTVERLSTVKVKNKNGEATFRMDMSVREAVEEYCKINPGYEAVKEELIELHENYDENGEAWSGQLFWKEKGDTYVAEINLNQDGISSMHFYFDRDGGLELTLGSYKIDETTTQSDMLEYAKAKPFVEAAINKETQGDLKWKVEFEGGELSISFNLTDEKSVLNTDSNVGGSIHMVIYKR